MGRMGHPTHLLMALTWDRPPTPPRPCGHNYPLERFPRQRTIRAAPVRKRRVALGLPSIVQSSGNRSKHIQ
jgi:hypothetical protein